MSTDEEAGNDVRRTTSRQTPTENSSLLGPITSSRKSSAIRSSNRRHKDATNGWSVLRNHLKEGDLLIKMAAADEQKSGKSRESIRRKTFEEFDAETGFGVAECIAAIVVYLVASVLIFSYLLEPNWTIIDSCYFAVSTFTTLGPGDLTPSLDNRFSVVFTCLYVLLGVACLGVALGVLGDNLLDTQHRATYRASKMAKYQALTMFDPQNSDDSSEEMDVEDSQALEEPKEVWQIEKGVRFLLFLSGMMFLALLIGMGSKWSTLDTVYYLIITGCTVGYGDLVPVSQEQRFFAIIFIPIACCVIGYYLGFFATTVIEMRSARYRNQFATHELTQDDIDAMDIHGTGKVKWEDFLVFLLVAMNKIDHDLVDELRVYFNRLDADGNGELSTADMVQRAKENLKSPRRKLELSAYKAHLLRQLAENRRMRPTFFRRFKSMMPSFKRRGQSE